MLLLVLFYLNRQHEKSCYWQQQNMDVYFDYFTWNNVQSKKFIVYWYTQSVNIKLYKTYVKESPKSVIK